MALGCISNLGLGMVGLIIETTTHKQLRCGEHRANGLRLHAVAPYKGINMRPETKRCLEQMVIYCNASNDPAAVENARVVSRDLLNGGRAAYIPVNAVDPSPAPVDESPQVKWKPKRKS